MAKGPFREESTEESGKCRMELLQYLNDESKKVSYAFISRFGRKKRKHKVRLLTGFKIIKINKDSGEEGQAFVCKKKSEEVDYGNVQSFILAKTYVDCMVEKCELRPVVLIEKDGRYFEVISRPVDVLFPEDVERIQWEKKLSATDEKLKQEIMLKVIMPRRNFFQRLIGQMFNL